MKNIRRKVNIAIKKFIKNEKFGVLPSRRKSSTIKMEEKRGVRSANWPSWLETVFSDDSELNTIGNKASENAAYCGTNT